MPGPPVRTELLFSLIFSSSSKTKLIFKQKTLFYIFRNTSLIRLYVTPPMSVEFSVNPVYNWTSEVANDVLTVRDLSQDVQYERVNSAFYFFKCPRIKDWLLHYQVKPVNSCNVCVFFS